MTSLWLPHKNQQQYNASDGHLMLLGIKPAPSFLVVWIGCQRRQM
jgi:hypothetical protein